MHTPHKYIAHSTHLHKKKKHIRYCKNELLNDITGKGIGIHSRKLRSGHRFISLSFEETI